MPVSRCRQLSRQAEMRESKEPRLSDLRESGSIEQDADLVMFLWREKERGAEDEDAEGEVIKLQARQAPQRPTGEIEALVQEAPDALRQLRGLRALRRGVRLTAVSSALRAAVVAVRSDTAHGPGR